MIPDRVGIVAVLCTWCAVFAARGAWSQEAPAPFEVVQVQPGHRTVDVELDPLIQIHVSERFDPATVHERSVQLVDRTGKPVEVVVSGDLGGVINVSPREPLAPDETYRIRVGPPLRSAGGSPIRGLTVEFRTGSPREAPSREDLAAFRFTRDRIARRDGVCGLALAPGNQLFACTWDGVLLRWQLDEMGRCPEYPQVLLERDRRFCAMVADPLADSQRVVLWLVHDSLKRASLGPNDFSGVLSRLTIERSRVDMQDIVVGLPTGDHPASGLVFGPDGRLFLSQGATTMLGSHETRPETRLSAATLVLDLQHPQLRRGRAPLDVRTNESHGYDPEGGPLTVFASGIREAFDLCWHSNGQLYAGVNMNDTNESTPAREGLPAVNVRPAEMMVRIVEGGYYGHPNPARGEWVLLGGNPTAGVDPWEVAALPVGTRPEARFDPSLFIRNLQDDHGPSADGCCEWRGPGPLGGRLIFCFYTATRGLHSYALSEDGHRVVDHQPLLDERLRRLRFGAPLDVVYDERGWLYVADFSAPERGDSGLGGGVWLVKPLHP